MADKLAMSDSRTATPAAPETIKFTYIKSSSFRVIHVDGAVAGASPGGLFISLYSERTPIPQQQGFEVNADHRLGSEIEALRVTREGIVREVEAGLVISFDAAVALAELLDRLVKTLKAEFSKAPNQSPSSKS